MISLYRKKSLKENGWQAVNNIEGSKPNFRKILPKILHFRKKHDIVGKNKNALKKKK